MLSFSVESSLISLSHIQLLLVLTQKYVSVISEIYFPSGLAGALLSKCAKTNGTGPHLFEVYCGVRHAQVEFLFSPSP